MYFISILLLILLITSCGNPQKQDTKQTPKTKKVDTRIFTKLDSKETGVDFKNLMPYEDITIFWDYINFFDGGGVAIGDINNDGLPDIYFSGNFVANQLFLNKGDMKFQDITEQAKVLSKKSWSTGLTMADVNGDGWLDIYVCLAMGEEDDPIRENQLYINNGDLTFTESSKAYGVNDPGYSAGASFFDYDLDGDLDLFVGNYPRKLGESPETRYNKWKNPILEESDRLYKNNGDGTFTDVTIEAGILNRGWTLGLITSDINQDGWPDIYVCVDHDEPDLYYINNGDGTFTNKINESFKHISNLSMGIDLADINNDALLDIMIVDMMAEDNYRQKTQMSGMDPKRFWEGVSNGYHHQYMRNTLQLNNGNGTFSEIGQLAGISQTDWSWAILLADFDNDSDKDIFVTNGYLYDYRDNDFNQLFLQQKHLVQESGMDPNIDFLKRNLTSTKTRNYYFQNNGDLTFDEISARSGIVTSDFSSGAAYADLDNDGDLDLVISNLTEEAIIYRNESNKNGKNYLKVKFQGYGMNLFGIGAKVTITTGNEQQYQELTLTRGFQSSVEPILHFGLNDYPSIDKIYIQWPDHKVQTIENVKVNQTLTILHKDAINEPDARVKTNDKIFAVIEERASGINFIHKENEFNDYEKEILLPHKMSQFGPNIAVGDVNGDGLDDFFIGGAHQQSGALYIQDKNSTFDEIKDQPWTSDLEQEDIGSLFFDSDGDGDLDLYVVSGGNEFDTSSTLLQDRLYINNGEGDFEKADGALPKMTTSGSCVEAFDYDMDGDLDLFVGGRVLPGYYPFPTRSYILNNDGGNFSDVTAAIAPELVYAGLVTSAVWTDVNGDDQTDLIVVGEWMPITVFINSHGKFKNTTSEYGFENTNGWWNKITQADFDGDGDMDYIVGNLGTNYKYQVTATEPLHIYCHDFDNSGTYDIVLGSYNSGVCYPVRGRQCSSQQMPNIKSKFPTYKQFALSNIEGIYGAALDDALHYEAKYFSSAYIENQGNGKLILKKLPVKAQFSTVFGIINYDFDGDKNMDALIAGNFYVSEVETGRADASIGLLLSGDGAGNFDPVSVSKSGFIADLDVRDIAMVMGADGRPIILVANNNAPMQIFKLNSPSF